MNYINMAQELGFPSDTVHRIEEIESYTVPDELANRYFYGRMPIKDALDILKLDKRDDIHLYEKYMLFLLACAEYMKDDYKKFGISDEIYHETALDIKYKFDECKTVFGVSGVSDPMWFDGFFRLTRFGIGRLQYERKPFEFEDFTKGGHTIEHGATVYNCHIPSSGALRQDDVLSSFKAAYEFFENELCDGVMPIICYSWLLFPELEQILGDKSNIVKFSKLFSPIKAIYRKGFSNAWRVFGKPYEGSGADMPKDTSMQRTFLKHLDSGNCLGIGIGMLLFDGEKIL